MGRSRIVLFVALWVLSGLAPAGCSGCDTPSLDDGGVFSDGPGPEASPPAPDLRPDAPPDAAAPLLIFEVKVQSNPLNELSCFVSWRTSVGASSVVEFWEPGAVVGHRVSSAGLQTSHLLLVFGMHAETAYILQASSSAGKRQARSAPLQYTTGKLPLHVPPAELVIHDPRRAYQGWTLMTLSAGSRGNGLVTMDPEFRPTVVMFDM